MFYYDRELKRIMEGESSEYPMFDSMGDCARHETDLRYYKIGEWERQIVEAQNEIKLLVLREGKDSLYTLRPDKNRREDK